LHCISGYPTPIEDCNLNTLKDLQQRFNFPIGLSDHTIDNTASIASVCLGASIIEKHFTIDKTDGSVDAAFSLEPEQFSRLVMEAKRAKQALGNAGYSVKPSEAGGREFRRSLYCCAALKKGQPFTRDNVRSVRPGLGLHTRYLDDVIGKVAKSDIEFGTPLAADMVEGLALHPRVSKSQTRP